MAYMLPQRSQPQLRTLFFTLLSGKPDGQDAPWPSSMRARDPSNFDSLLSRFSSSVAIISSILCQPSGSPSSTVLPPTSSFSRMQLSQISFKSSILAPSSPQRPIVEVEVEVGDLKVVTIFQHLGQTKCIFP